MIKRFLITLTWDRYQAYQALLIKYGIHYVLYDIYDNGTAQIEVICSKETLSNIEKIAIKKGIINKPFSKKGED